MPLYWAGSSRISSPVELDAKVVPAVAAASNSTTPVPLMTALPPVSVPSTTIVPPFALSFPVLLRLLPMTSVLPLVAIIDPALTTVLAPVGRDPGRVDDPAGFIVELEPSAADGAAAHDGFVKIGERDRRAAQMITSGIDAQKATGATFFIPWFASSLASAYAELGKIEDAGRCIGEAMTAAESTKEKWYEAEINRIAGEIALKPPERDTAKAESYFERALTVARQQQAKSWELRAAMSLARLWRDQGKRDEARELLAPVYGWFTEGFETRDLKEAKALLDELGA